MNYYTTMNSDGTLFLTFNISISNFLKLEDKQNPRICIGFRESGTTLPFDIAVLSMPQFVQGTWVTYDSMGTDPNAFC